VIVAARDLTGGGQGRIEAVGQVPFETQSKEPARVSPYRVRDGYLVIQPGTRHTVAPEGLRQTYAGSDS
jgi:hypothetical protein